MSRVRLAACKKIGRLPKIEQGPTLANAIPSVSPELTEAVKSRNVTLINQLLENNDDVNARFTEKLLHQVFHDANGDLKLQAVIIEILELLLQDFPVYVNAKNDAGHTVLHLAIENRMTRVIEFLISRAADQKVRDEFGNSILQFSINSELRKLKNYRSIRNVNRKRALEEESRCFIEWMVLQNLDADLNIKNDSGYTMLYLAIESRMTQLINFLTICGANLHDADGSSVLHFLIDSESRKFQKLNNKLSEFKKLALEEESIKFIEWMISERPEYVDSKNQDGDTPLHLAAECKLLHALPPLLKYTKDVTIANTFGKTAFQVFVESISRADDPIKHYETTSVEIVCKKFLNKGFSVDVIDFDDNTPLHCALNQRKRNCAKLMLKYLKNVDARDEKRNTALNIIMNYDRDGSDEFGEVDEQMVRILLSEGANVHKLNKYSFSPLSTAVKNKKLNMLRIFKEHGEDFCYSYSGGNLLHRFVTSNVQTDLETDMAILDFLINEGCKVNAKDDKGMTPLHLAVQHGKMEMSKGLIQFGAFVNQRGSSHGYSPLHVAVKNNHTNLMALLIKNGADVNATTYTGQTPLHLHCKEATIKKLIELGASVSIMDKSDLLPLHTAILERNSQWIRDLLKFGADINDNAHLLRRRDYLITPACVSEHLIKLRAVGLPVDKKLECVLEYPSVKSYIEPFYENCLKEVERLKSCEIDHCKSLYDLLLMNWNDVCAYVKNEKLENIIRSLEFDREFPMYHTLISSAYYMAFERRTMLEPAKQAWLELTSIRLPDLCLHEIFNYVSNVTLRSMIVGVKK